MLIAILALAVAIPTLVLGFIIGYRTGRIPTAAVDAPSVPQGASDARLAAEPQAATPAALESVESFGLRTAACGVPDISDFHTDGVLACGKVMIVDDEPINIKVAQKYLRLSGYDQIVGVTDPTTVMSRLAEEQPDVVLLDIMMPKVSGLEILEEIRRERRWAYLPVIIVTASDNEETKLQALELGATDFLGKPVNGTDLIPRVRNALLVKAHHDYLKHYAKELERQTRQLEAQIAQARTDALTGLANRRALDEEMGRHYNQSLRTGSPLSAMLLDVDEFKAFNDTHGHRAGDEALRVVAGILRNAMRQMDVVTRYGGEEFLVMLPGTTLEGARLVAERTRQDISKTRFRYDGKNFSLTVSVGVAQLAGNEHVTQMLLRCDQAMYAAKQAGRNLTYWHDGRAAYDVADESVTDHTLPPTPMAMQATSAPPMHEQESSESSGFATATLENLASASQASFDSLGTHCDRSAFFWQVHQRIAEWKRGANAFCLMLVRVVQEKTESGPQDESDDLVHDIDPSREVLDEAVRVTARILSTVVREMDMIGRYDSHGLCLLLPRATLEQGSIVAQRVRRHISANEPGVSLMPERFGVHVGIAEVGEGDDPVRLFQRAEAVMADFSSISSHA